MTRNDRIRIRAYEIWERESQTGATTTVGAKRHARSRRRTLRGGNPISGRVSQTSSRMMKVPPTKFHGGKVLQRTVQGAISQRLMIQRLMILCRTGTLPASH